MIGGYNIIQNIVNQKVMEKLIIGPLQEMWLKSLEEHPERQMKSVLGKGSPDDYKACCLGEALICIAKFKGEDILSLFVDEYIKDLAPSDESDAKEYMDHSYKIMGLNSPQGEIKYGADIPKLMSNRHTVYEADVTTLAHANDGGQTWPEIAAFIRAYPETVFTHSV